MQARSLSPRNPDAPTVPVIGMGTSQTLDTDDIEAARAVVEAALAAGTTLFDSSPMYGAAEEVLGECLDGRRDEVVVATKVWTEDDTVAERQITASLAMYGGRIELLQVHNMVAWRTRLDQIERRRDQGSVRLVGATHWQVAGFADLEAAMATGRVDAIQVPYNPIERDVEARILPMAADLGLGVLVMRPLAKAALLRRTPAEGELARLAPFGITTWAQALLRWGLAHPAVTAAIPATSRPERAVENAAAGDGPPLDDEHRQLIARWFGARR